MKLLLNLTKYFSIFENLVGPKPLRIIVDRIFRFIRTYDDTRYLSLFGSKYTGAICNTSKCLISLQSGVTYLFSHYFAKIKVYCCHSLSIEKD